MPPSPLSKFGTFCPSYKKFWAISKHTAFSHPKPRSHRCVFCLDGFVCVPRGQLCFSLVHSSPRREGCGPHLQISQVGFPGMLFIPLGWWSPMIVNFWNPLLKWNPRMAHQQRGESLGCRPQRYWLRSGRCCPRLAPAVPERTLGLGPDSASRRPGGKVHPLRWFLPLPRWFFSWPWVSAHL